MASVYHFGMDIDEFRERHSKRPPRSTKEFDANEFKQWSAAYGVRVLMSAPAQDVEFGKPGAKPHEDGINTYLWVIDDQGIPYVIERPIDGRPVPKHTNLTGGAAAYIGGQIWFSSGTDLFLSGGSGRYPPRNEIELCDAAGVFESYGYMVTSLGWDEKVDMAMRYYSEE